MSFSSSLNMQSLYKLVCANSFEYYFRFCIEYKQRMQSNYSDKPTIAWKLPPLNEEVVQDQDDNRSVSQTCEYPLLSSSSHVDWRSACWSLVLPKVNTYRSYNKIINSNNTNINPVTITVDNQKVLRSPSKENRFVHLLLRISKYTCCVVALLVIIVGVLLTVLAWRNQATKKSDCRSEYEQRQQNKTIDLLTERISEKDQRLEQLTNQIKLQQTENGKRSKMTRVILIRWV